MSNQETLIPSDRVKLQRTSKGVYYWEITSHKRPEEKRADLMRRLKSYDALLRGAFPNDSKGNTTKFIPLE